MKRLFYTLLIALAYVLSGTVNAASVQPIVVPDWKSGNAGFECQQASKYTGVSYVYWYKIDPPGNGTYTATFPDGHTNNITITNYSGTSFDWYASPNSIGAVIVKGGTYANIYKYDPQVFSDTNLMSPINPNNNKPYEISHITFCWNPMPRACYQVETAWAQGTRYVTRGNWAMYVAYNGGTQTYNLLAAQTINVGTVTISPSASAGYVDIRIQLNSGVYFAYGDEYGGLWSESLHIQGYNTIPPARNPAPGQFEFKYNATSQSWTVTVPYYPYYGIHLKVAIQIPCPMP